MEPISASSAAALTAAAAVAPRNPVSVLVLARDEQACLPACLASVAWCDDVVVLDGGSKDRTLAIAREKPNVRVVERKWDDEVAQRTFGLKEIEFRNPWVLILDADETVPPDLAHEISQTLTGAGPETTHAAFALRYREMYRGRWIRHGGAYPIWSTRLVRPGRVRYENFRGAARLVVDGTIGKLQGHFIHEGLDAGMRRYFDRRNLAAQVESRATARPLGSLGSDAGGWGLGLTLDMWAQFVWTFIFRLGFLDGVAGFHFCAIHAMQVYWVGMKVMEQERAWIRQTEVAVTRLLAEEGK
ncbi:MAG: glycosyltransferase family 2 protein [Planctomycetota bacterium]|nr:glycosyltransferase family 2 protein [Planctomycetota bacterium]